MRINANDPSPCPESPIYFESLLIFLKIGRHIQMVMNTGLFDQIFEFEFTI